MPHSLQQPHEIPEDARDNAMGSYLMMFAAGAVGLPLPIINLLASGIYLYLNARKHPFVYFHSLQSMLSQTFVSLFNIGLFAWLIQLVFFGRSVDRQQLYAYIALVVLLNLIYFVVSIIGAVRARKGLMYYMPFFGPLAYYWVYVRDTGAESRPLVNHTPF
jgi:uncharacterized membrane protein